MIWWLCLCVVTGWRWCEHVRQAKQTACQVSQVFRSPCARNHVRCDDPHLLISAVPIAHCLAMKANEMHEDLWQHGILVIAFSRRKSFDTAAKVASRASQFASDSIKVLRLLAACFHVSIHFIASLMQPVRCSIGSSLWSCQNVWDVLHDDVSLLLRSSEETMIQFSCCIKEAGI